MMLLINILFNKQVSGDLVYSHDLSIDGVDNNMKV